MLENTSFTFNGISSEDMGVMMINPSSGLYEETFLPSRNIIDTSVFKGKKRYFKGVEIEPLSFSMAIWIKDWRDRNNIRAIARWLWTDFYCPLWFNNEPEKIYYAMVTGEPKLIHNGLREGFIELTFRCKDAYRYSPKKTYDFYVDGEETWNFFNEGDATIRPFLKITQIGDKIPIIIRNITDNKEFIITNVLANEIVTVDCENEMIVSSQEYNSRYLYDFHNDYWLDFQGEEARECNSNYEIQFQGNYKIEFSVEYKYLQEGGELTWEL